MPRLTTIALAIVLLPLNAPAGARAQQQAPSATAPATSTAAPDDGTRYVSDTLTITVRTGKGNSFQIIRTIDSGTKVQQLQATQDGYSKIRLADGTQGWVLSRYLTRQPIARDRLAAAQARSASLAQANDQLKSRLDGLRSDDASVKTQLAQASADRDRLAGALKALRGKLGDPHTTEAQLLSLRARVKNLRVELEHARRINAKLRDTTRRSWFLVGAGVLLGGILLGLIIPRLRPRRRSSWGTL